MSFLLKIIGVIWLIVGFLAYNHTETVVYQTLLESGQTDSFTPIFYGTLAVVFVLPALLFISWGSSLRSQSIRKPKAGLRILGLDIFVWLLVVGLAAAYYYGNQ